MKGLQRWSISLWRGPQGGGGSFTGDPGRYVKKGFGNLHRGPLTAENLEGGSYTGDFERCMKEGSTNRSFLSEKLHEGDLEGGFLYWRPERYVK